MASMFEHRAGNIARCLQIFDPLRGQLPPDGIICGVHTEARLASVLPEPSIAISETIDLPLCLVRVTVPTEGAHRDKIKLMNTLCGHCRCEGVRVVCLKHSLIV